MPVFKQFWLWEAWHKVCEDWSFELYCHINRVNCFYYEQVDRPFLLRYLPATYCRTFFQYLRQKIAQNPSVFPYYGS